MSSNKLLLQACCGPCATTALERLLPEYRITIYFFNPNIQPEKEYTKRLEQFQLLQKHYPFELIEARDHIGWLNAVKGLENEPEGGKRCAQCFRYRLQSTAQAASSSGFDLFSTTLTVSPHKDSQLINSIGQELSKAQRVPYLSLDLKADNGVSLSRDISKKYGLYRQNYCGCVFSQR